MKNTIKLFSLLFVFACFISCDNDNGLGFQPSPEKGWVQFLQDSPDVINFSQGVNNEALLDVNIQVPTTSSDLTINYEFVSVSGLDPNTIFSNTNTVIPAGLTSYSGPDNNTGINYAYLGQIVLNLAQVPALTENMVFDVVLTETSSSQITVGLASENYKVVQRIALCPTITSSTYTGDGFSSDLGDGPGTFPPYQVTFNPVMGETNTWDVDSTWGPDFVHLLCNGCVAPGSLPYPSTIVLNDDHTVTVIGGTSYAPGTTGIEPSSDYNYYDACADEFVLKIGQAVFNGSFTVDVVLTGNGD